MGDEIRNEDDITLAINLSKAFITNVKNKIVSLNL